VTRSGRRLSVGLKLGNCQPRTGQGTNRPIGREGRATRARPLACPALRVVLASSALAEEFDNKGPARASRGRVASNSSGSPCSRFPVAFDFTPISSGNSQIVPARRETPRSAVASRHLNLETHFTILCGSGCRHRRRCSPAIIVCRRRTVVKTVRPRYAAGAPS
jgi:hypothetical protein